MKVVMWVTATRLDNVPGSTDDVAVIVECGATNHYLGQNPDVAPAMCGALSFVVSLEGANQYPVGKRIEVQV